MEPREALAIVLPLDKHAVPHEPPIRALERRHEAAQCTMRCGMLRMDRTGQAMIWSRTCFGFFLHQRPVLFTLIYQSENALA